MIDPDFWRLLVTISATMIGLVFLGTIYYLESGSEEFDIYQREMEALTVSAAQLIIVYFSTVLVLSLFQEPFLPSGLTVLAFVGLTVGVVVITRSANKALHSFEDAPLSDSWNSVLLRLSRVSNWVAFIAVFVAPIVVFHDAGSVLSTGDGSSTAELSIAWTVVLALLFGYWNLVQFLLLPYEIREQEREIRKNAEHAHREDDPGFERGAGTLDRPLDTVVGRTEKLLYRQSFLESAWKTLFNDALRAHFDTDLAVSHGFRYGTAIPPGDITLGELYTFFPMTTPVARGVAYGQQLTNHLEKFLEDNFTPYPYDQEDGRVRNFSSNVEVTVDPTAKRGRRLVEMQIDGETIDPEETYSVATFRRPGDPERDLGNCGFPFQDVEVDDGTIPVDVIAEYLEEHSPVDYEVMGLVETADDGGRVQNTPADGPYPSIQPGVDYTVGEAYCETSMIPRSNTFPEEGRNRTR